MAISMISAPWSFGGTKPESKYQNHKLDKPKLGDSKTCWRSKHKWLSIKQQTGHQLWHVDATPRKKTRWINGRDFVPLIPCKLGEESLLLFINHTTCIYKKILIRRKKKSNLYKSAKFLWLCYYFNIHRITSYSITKSSSSFAFD